MYQSLTDAPGPIAASMNNVPQNNVGTLFAKLKPPFSPIGAWFKVPVWGQVCDGRAHKDAVGGMLHNDFPRNGKGWTYLEWKAVPDNPEACKYPLRGKVEKPNRFNGGTEHSYQCFAEDAWQ